MPSPRLLALASLIYFIPLTSAASYHISQNGVPGSSVVEVTHPTTDNTAILQTIGQVNQKTSAPIDAPPSSSVPPVIVTAVDGSLVNSTVSDVTSASSSRRRRSRRSSLPQVTPLQRKRSSSDYVQVFAPEAAGVHDGSIEGSAYLTYTVVNNATYNIDDCLAFCDRVEGCEFVNLYYEFNNELLDFVFSEKSNLKCSAYGDVHNASEKTNLGGQASYTQVGNQPVPLTYITESSGWALKPAEPTEPAQPATPAGYELVFGPTGGANNAPGYMGFAFLDRYDVDACAALCNGRGYDAVGGVCQYFNIWRAVVDGVPTTYTCSMYYLVADESTAVNYGQGDLVVTLSRGYKRLSVLPDGGFESYTCDDFCYAASSDNWVGTTPSGGALDATIFHYSTFAHTGNVSALLGAANGDDSDAGSLSPAKPLTTVKGSNYVLQLFVANDFSDDVDEAAAAVEVLWNGKQVGSVTGVQHYAPSQFNVVGTGADVLTIQGGAAPAWSFVDDVFIALL
ncbi:hypothetical protein FB45DRAFT_782995 [Roridomyces roridus]|uniref:Fruit-body specific protein a n=1 Tax=Roridomyces roridus TaxID=1738132 RepID=A0AAD7CGG5_9AGAR|nr:hypothetical protein FB45DRAFT_782995 [Roridomyces roridus]